MKPKIMLWDIETGYQLMTNHSLFAGDRGFHFEHIRDERYIISISYKWLGEKSVHNLNIADYPRRFARNPHDDRELIRDFLRILSTADALVHHYGDRFDLPTLNTRAIANGFTPVHNVFTIDTYKIAKKHFRFNSNKLDYLGKFLGVGRKLSTNENLWWRCYQGDKKAVKEMARYNSQDVELLEKVYTVLQPFASRRLNMALFSDSDTLVCPSCGGDHLHQRGYYYTSTAKKAKFQCQDCGAWSSETVSTTKRVRIK